MTPDYDRYRPHMAQFNLSKAEEDDLIHIVFAMMQSFVDRAFGDDPVQLALAAQDGKSASGALNMVSSREVKRLSPTFNIKKGQYKNG